MDKKFSTNLVRTNEEKTFFKITIHDEEGDITAKAEYVFKNKILRVKWDGGKNYHTTQELRDSIKEECEHKALEDRLRKTIEAQEIM